MCAIYFQFVLVLTFSVSNIPPSYPIPFHPINLRSRAALSAFSPFRVRGPKSRSPCASLFRSSSSTFSSILPKCLDQFDFSCAQACFQACRSHSIFPTCAFLLTRCSLVRALRHRYDSHHPPSVHVLLPAAHVGRLVGKAGAMIKRIQQHNRSAISIGADVMPHSTEKLATVQVCVW